jgi:glycopeptide antibiotics resistance protein
MGILAPFIHPQDTRWRTGPQRHHHTIFLAKNLLLIPFIILVIVEFAVFKSSWKWDIEVYAP